jgi:hypothetical protein
MRLHTGKSRAERDAVELDKQRWFNAWSQLRHYNHHQICNWLETLPRDEQKDMRRRLNAMRGTVQRAPQQRPKP